MRFIVPKRKRRKPEPDPSITIIEQIQEGATYYTDWRGVFPYRLEVPVGADKFDSGAINQGKMTFYPDADAETTSVDGVARHNITGEAGDTWAALRGGAGTGAESTSGLLDALIRSGTSSGKWDLITKSILLFDTSFLPDNATITYATLSIRGWAKQDDLSISPRLNIYTSNPASDTEVVAGDFDSLGTTALCDTAITYANFDASGWNNFALNAAGLATILKTGITKLGFREVVYDALNVEPSWTSKEVSGFYFYSTDSGIHYKPRLTVTYEEYGGGVWIEDEKFHFISETNTEQIALNESTFDANTILKADSNDTPEALTVAVQRIIGRVTAGEIDALTGAQILTILTGQAGATFSWNSQALTSVSEITLTPKASSSGVEGTIFYDSDDDHLYVATE